MSAFKTKICCKEPSEMVWNNFVDAVLPRILDRLTPKGQSFIMIFNRASEGDTFRDIAEVTIQESAFIEMPKEQLLALLNGAIDKK